MTIDPSLAEAAMKSSSERICPFTNQQCKDCSALFVDTPEGADQYVSGCRIVSGHDESADKEV